MASFHKDCTSTRCSTLLSRSRPRRSLTALAAGDRPPTVRRGVSSGGRTLATAIERERERTNGNSEVERLKADLEAEREPLDLPTLPLRGNRLTREH